MDGNVDSDDDICTDKSNDQPTLQQAHPGDVLYDTLYRYMVLFGFQNSFENTNMHGISLGMGMGISGGSDIGQCWVGNPVWAILVDHLQEPISYKKKGRKVNERERQGRMESVGCYKRDSASWNVLHGTHPVMIRYATLHDVLIIQCFIVYIM